MLVFVTRTERPASSKRQAVPGRVGLRLRGLRSPEESGPVLPPRPGGSVAALQTDRGWWGERYTITE